MRIQVQEYISFVKGFTDETNIMTKSFFIVIPYARAGLPAKASGFSGIFRKKTSAEEKETKELEAFEEVRSQLEQRANVIKQGLARTGVRAVALGTEEVTELYYKFFNPSETEKPIKT